MQCVGSRLKVGRCDHENLRGRPGCYITRKISTRREKEEKKGTLKITTPAVFDPLLLHPPIRFG